MQRPHREAEVISLSRHLRHQRCTARERGPRPHGPPQARIVFGSPHAHPGPEREDGICQQLRANLLRRRKFGQHGQDVRHRGIRGDQRGARIASHDQPRERTRTGIRSGRGANRLTRPGRKTGQTSRQAEHHDILHMIRQGDRDRRQIAALRTRWDCRLKRSDALQVCLRRGRLPESPQNIGAAPAQHRDALAVIGRADRGRQGAQR